MVLFAVLFLFDWHSLEWFGAQEFKRIVGSMAKTSCTDLVLNTCSSCGGIGRYYCIGLDGKVGSHRTEGMYRRIRQIFI
jgi:hypothetical protein